MLPDEKDPDFKKEIKVTPKELVGYARNHTNYFNLVAALGEVRIFVLDKVFQSISISGPKYLVKRALTHFELEK